VGETLKKYPEYLQYDLQTKLPEIYREAGNSGNLIIAAPNPIMTVPQTHPTAPTARTNTTPSSATNRTPAPERPNPAKEHAQRVIPHEP